MDRALFAAATGMAAQQSNLDTIANNLSNSDVAGFKASSQSFAELAAPGERGLGTTALGEHAVFTQGKLERSDGPFDVAIDGPGFFVVKRGTETAFTRDGSFARDADGALRNALGWELEGIRIPADALSAKVDADGTVSVTTPGVSTHAGRVRLAEFASPEHLRAVGGSLFYATAASGAAHRIAPGQPSGPHLRFGMLEASNVSIIESMMAILSAQRAYEANAKGVQAADEMLRIANNLQRG